MNAPDIENVQQALCLRIYIGEDARARDDPGTSTKGPAWRALLAYLREHDVWGATAWRGIAGYGPHGALHDVRMLATRREALPIVLEAIDRPDRLLRLLAGLAHLAPDALIVTHAVDVHRHMHAP